MFDGLNALPWYDLKHAYGSAEEVPMWLRRLTSSDERIYDEAINHLAGSICHQGWICPATAYAVPYLLELLQEPTVRAKKDILELLACIATADPELHEERWRKNPNVPSWEVPAYIPFKDAHLEITKGTSIYVTLLDAIDPDTRMQAANVLRHSATLTPDLQAHLIAVLAHEPELKVRANLVLLLGTLSQPGPEAQTLFVDVLRKYEDVLLVFCAQLMLARLAKDKTPQEVIQQLANVIIQPPEQLDVYKELPCHQGANWRAAALALGNLQPERLQELTPAFQEALIHAGQWQAMTLAEMLLFICFPHEKLADQKQWTQAEITEQQYAVLSLFFDRNDLWGYDVSPRLPDLLKAYGLPADKKQLADFLQREFLLPQQQKHSPYESITPDYQLRYDAFRDHLRGIFRKYFSKAYPEIRIRRMGGALADDLLTINDEIIFRIPDSPTAVSSMKREYTLLRLLQKRVPLPIPNPLYISQDSTELGQIFLGYSKLPGKPLYKELLESIDGDQTIDALVLQIASFLHTLHHIPISELTDIPLPVIHERERYESLYTQVRLGLFKHMPPDKCQQIATSFETFLDTPQNFALIPTLIHSNFGPHKILYNAKDRSISGIISFTQAGLGDPASDIATLFGPRGYDKSFLHHFEGLYHEMPLLRERIEFYANATILQDVFSQREEQNMKDMAQKLTFYPL